MKFDIYQVITDRIIGLLQSGTVPWRKPWKAGVSQQNLVSRMPYRGVNVFILNASKFASPYWLSFKQVQFIRATVRKGEHASPVVFWKVRDKEDKKDDGPERKRVPLLRYYNVFNVEQCENVKPSLLPTPEPNKFCPIERCDGIISSMPKRPEIMHGRSHASYSPMEDKVSMPNAGAFQSPESYYSTLFHELTHATGHRSRLARKEVMDPNSFGSDPYSREELVAEMGAAFLAGHSGIENHVLESSASYIENWLTRLKDDRKLVIHAAAQAQKACDFIRGELQMKGGNHVIPG